MKLLKWLSVADRFAKAYLDERLAPLGINSGQHIYLLKVCDEPGISQDSLLNSVYVHPSNIVRMVAALEKKGLLTRTPCPQDKRTWQLYPTAIAGQVRAACEETEDILLDSIPAQSQADFQSALYLSGRNMARKRGSGLYRPGSGLFGQCRDQRVLPPVRHLSGYFTAAGNRRLPLFHLSGEAGTGARCPSGGKRHPSDGRSRDPLLWSL